MRKIFAYVVTLLTLIMSVALCVPTIMDSSKFAMEYTGGFEVLYKVTSTTKNVGNNEIAKTIRDGMDKMLDINEISDAIITVENGNYIRANVTSKSQIISDKIKNTIQNSESYEITFRDSENNLLATGEQILEKIGATYKGEKNYQGYPVIYLNIADTDLLKSITTTISDAETKNLVIWVGFEDGVDSYENIQTSSTTAKKVIYNATVENPLNEKTITITGNYTEDAAKNTVNLINSGTYDYTLETVQLKSIKEVDAIASRNLILISLAIVGVLALVALVVLFKVNGVHAILPIVLTEALTLFAFNKIAGVVNPQVVGAFILSTVMMFTLYFLLLNKYQTTLKINKSPVKAYKETFKKNTPIIIDTCVAMVIFALVTYFLGNNAEHFATYLICGSVSTLLTSLLVERFVLFLTCDWFNKNNKTVIVSASKLINSDSDSVLDNVDLDSYTKHTSIGFASLAGLGIVIALILALVIKAPFNFYGDANESSTLEIIAQDDLLVDEEAVMNFFDKDDMNIEISTFDLYSENGNYHIVVTSDQKFSQYEAQLHKYLGELYGVNEEDGSIEYYVFYINDYNPTSLYINFTSTIYTSAMALVVIAIYFAFRFKYSYSLATITSGLMTTISLLAFFAITRIPVNAQSVVAINVVNTLSIIMLVPFFSKINELMKEAKKPYLSYEERVACLTRGRDIILKPTLVTIALFALISLTSMFFDLSNFSMYIALVIGSLFALIYNMIIVPKVWVLFENRHDKRKRVFKARDFSKSKYRTLDEQVFIGVND